MWRVIIVSCIAAVAARSVKNDAGDLAAILDDVFGPEHREAEYRSQWRDLFDPRQSGKYIANAQETDPAEPFVNEHKHWHRDHHEHHDHHGHPENRHGDVNLKHIHDHTVVPTSERYGTTKRPTTNTVTKPITQKTHSIQFNSNILKTNAVTNKTNHTTPSVAKTSTEVSKIQLNWISTTEAGSKDNASSVEDRWIWESGTTTPKPATVGLGDRAAFDGDKCPTGYVKFESKCVEED